MAETLTELNCCQNQGCQIQNLEISSLLLRNQKFIRRIYLQNQEENQEVFL
jgi:hypothetical protein